MRKQKAQIKEVITTTYPDRKSINDASQGIRIHREFDNLAAMEQFFTNKMEVITIDSRAHSLPLTVDSELIPPITVGSRAHSPCLIPFSFLF